jgi:hypothetical protein
MEEEAGKTQARLRELEVDQQAKGEENLSQIRFLEKENLELMMEIKGLKERIIKVGRPCFDELRGSSWCLG